MKHEKRELTEAINRYDENSHDSFIRLKNIVCRISDARKDTHDYFLDNLLYIAAQKMRVFGYNNMNGFNSDYINNLELSDYQFAKNKIIEGTYTSDTGSLLDYMQMRVFNIFDSLEDKRMLLSAPTSFGKTRLLREIIYRYRYNKIVLIFPTNALLFENYAELTRFNKDYNLGYNIVNNSNVKELAGEKFIFVLTPERYLKLKSDFPSMKIDFFFMDEIYKIDNFFANDEESEEDDRDKVFRIVLYILSKEVESYYLAGPYVNLKNVGDGLKRFIQINRIRPLQVNQELVMKNIIKCWEDKIFINKIRVKYYKDRNRITKDLVSTILSNDQGPILIYCNSKSAVDRLAVKISEISDYDRRKSSRLRNFIQHLENRYNFTDGDTILNWSVKKHLANNISVHYGSLPKYIQIEMLRLFNNNHTSIILSTTSITEGVNTNAKNLIFYGTTKGGKDLKVFDVKNIVGRAGRYYHHFVGNIYIFDNDISEKNNLDQSEKLDFVTFTNNNISDVDIDNTLIEDLVGENKNIKKDREEFIGKYDIPQSIFNKNRTINWEKQIQLYEIINKKGDKELVIYVMKMRTLNSFIAKENRSLEYMFDDLWNAKIIKEFERKIYPAIAKTYSYLGFRGLISYEIKERKDRKQKDKGLTSLTDSEYDTCYRNAFNKMNNIVEYKVPKFISLYATIFSYVCSQRNIEINEESIDTIINYYENGVFTTIGNYLSNRGFPNITIKELEKKSSDEMNMDIDEFKMGLISGNLQSITVLDSYEKDLLFEIFSIN